MRWEQPETRDGWLRKEVVSIALPPPPGHKSAVSLRAWRRGFWKAIRQMIEWPQASCDTNVQQSYFRGWRDPITVCIIFIRALITLWHVCRICKNSHLVLYTGPQYWNGKCKSSLIVGFLRKHFKCLCFMAKHSSISSFSETFLTHFRKPTSSLRKQVNNKELHFKNYKRSSMFDKPSMFKT